MLRTILILMTFFIVGHVNTQTVTFSLEVDQDSVKAGDLVTVTYKLVGARGEFVAPEFSDLRLVGGPNFSSQISIVNGKMDQSFTYSYIFQAVDPGDLLIPEASVNVEGETYTSPSAKVHVIENENWDPEKMAPLEPKRRKSGKDSKVTEI